MTKITVGFRNFSEAPINSTRGFGEGKKGLVMKGKKGNGHKYRREDWISAYKWRMTR
jgi:hypothetical protein